MAEKTAVKKETKTAPSPEKQIPNNVVQLGPVKCVGEECKRKPARAGFCDEHYMWFKEGLMTLQGEKARDFDKKFYAWQRRKTA